MGIKKQKSEHFALLLKLYILYKDYLPHKLRGYTPASISSSILATS